MATESEQPFQIYLKDGTGSLVPKADNARDAARLYRAVGIEPDGITARLLELSADEQRALEDEWAIEAAKPLKLDPGAELDAALAEVQAGLSNVSTVAGLKAALNDAIDAMRGQGGRAGRVAGRPV